MTSYWNISHNKKGFIIREQVKTRQCYYVFKIVYLVLSVDDCTGNWTQSSSSNFETLDVSCIKISNVKIKCTFQGLNTDSLINTFTINGSIIQNDKDTDITGSINTNGGNITWNDGTTFYSTWTRPISKVW